MKGTRWLCDTDCGGICRLLDSSPAFIDPLARSLDAIRNIGFTDTQVYCATGTKEKFPVLLKCPSSAQDRELIDD
jgi:hypothetical protein